MTLEERYATLMWMAEHGYEEDKYQALGKALARLTGQNLSPVTITVTARSQTRRSSHTTTSCEREN